MKLLRGVTLLLTFGVVAVHAEEADIIATCNRYLNSEGNERKELETRIASFDGSIDRVVKALSRPAAALRKDVSGVLAHQSFTGPELKRTRRDDVLHFYVPDAYTPASPFGLLIFMHGGGRKTPRDHALHVVAHPSGDPKSCGLQPHFENSPFIIVAPSAPWNEKTGARWNVPEADDYISDVIKECRHRFNTDSDRVFLGGYSMGGFGAFHLCQRLSDRLAGGIIYSGAWKTTHWKAWTGLPVFLRHGAADATAPGADGTRGRPRYTDVFYSRAAHRRLGELAIPHVYIEDRGGHAIRDAEESLSRLSGWMEKQRRDPFAPHVVAISKRGWKSSSDTPTPHSRWITIHEIGTKKIPFDRVVLDGPSPAWKETKEAFERQVFRLGKQQVEAGLVDARIEGANRIVIRTENVRRFSVWLHPAMIDFSRPVRVAVNGRESVHDVKERLLDTLRSYERREDWRLLYHAELRLSCEE